MNINYLLLLETANWPALLVDGSGRIRKANEHAAEVFGKVVQGEAPKLSSIWASSNASNSDQFVVELSRKPTSKTNINYQVKGGGSSEYLTHINTVDLDGQRYALLQLMNEAKVEPAQNRLENPLVETNVQQKQKLDCAFQLARSVALDFNNALTIILGHASLMLTKISADSPWRSSLLEMEKSAERAAEIAADLASFSRQEKDAKAYAAGNLNVLLRQTCDMFHSRPGPSIEWQMKLESKLYATHLDEAKVLQSLTKVMENAVEALGATGGVIEVVSVNKDLEAGNELRLTPGHYVEIEIADKGVGMSKETLARVFEPFFTTKKGHRGLGLAWVYGIVTNHGGIVIFDSEEGMGTRVKICLPASKKQLVDGGCNDDELKGSQTVMIVDDEELILTLGQTVLSTYGYRVLTATSGAGALKAFENPEEAIDLLISDLVMPQMSGRELIETVKKRSPDTRVLSCSGFIQPTQSEDELYLKKPFTTQQLLQKVKQVLG